MKILLIEDEDRGVRQARVSIEKVFGPVELRVAGNLDEAKTAVAEEGFDLAICDIRITSNATVLDANEAHGLAAYADLHANAPGTPTVFLSAFASVENTSSQASRGGTADVFGLSDFALTQVVPKGDPEKIEGYLDQIRNGIDLLNSCSIDEAERFDEMFVRAAQMYGLTIGSHHAYITHMGGLSGAHVGLVRYLHASHGEVTVVVKLDRHERVQQEVDRYNRLVAPRLAVGDFAPQLKTYKAGLRGKTAVVSSVASPSSASLFGRLAHPVVQVDVGSVRSALSGWSAISEHSLTTLGDYRRSVISDNLFSQLPVFSPELLGLDEMELDLSLKLGHGDFHGENVLIDDKGRAVLIDFADCDVFPAGVDAAALELSLYAHPSSPIGEIWPQADFSNWVDVEAFTVGSPWATFIRDIREWTQSEANEVQALSVYYVQACWLMKHGGDGAIRSRAVALSALSRLRMIA